MKCVLTIAGSDSSGGAGIQADIKTICANGAYAMSAVTALTAQNTLGVSSILDVPPDFLAKQLDAVFEDIPPDAVKIGMTSKPETISVIAERLRHHSARNTVLDPVMVATAGSALICDDAVDTMMRELLPICALATPNIPEAEVLSGMKISSLDDMSRSAENLSHRFGCAVLVKGGHSVNDAVDILYADGKTTVLRGKFIRNPNTHGTGCTLSSAIAANLAKGFPLEEAVLRAKRYLEGALGAMLELGRGSGPLMHNFNVNGEFAEEA